MLNLDRKLRAIDINLTLLSQPLNFQQAEEGVANLKSLVADGHQTLLEVRDGLRKHIGERIATATSKANSRAPRPDNERV